MDLVCTQSWKMPYLFCVGIWGTYVWVFLVSSGSLGSSVMIFWVVELGKECNCCMRWYGLPLLREFRLEVTGPGGHSGRFARLMLLMVASRSSSEFGCP